MNKKITNLLILSAAILASLCSISQVNAESGLTKDELKEYNANNISFYLPCGGSNNSGICGDNKNYAGEQVWTDAQMEALKANQPFYEKAAGEYNFPWQILAVIHMREHGLARSNPSNGQGVYQFYSASSRNSCSGGNFTPGPISDEQFQIQTNCAAKKIAEGYGSGLDLNTDDGVKKMFFKYNGAAQIYVDQALSLGFSQEEAENGEGSPYVMNRYDKKREPSSTWGQIKSDGGSIEYPANNDFGAFVYYKAIYCGGSSSSSSLPACTGEGSRNIAQAAFELAWPEGTSSSKYAYPEGSATDKFTTALDKFYPEHSKWGAAPSVGASCDVFVGTVVRYAGIDSKYPRGLDGVWNDIVNKGGTDIWEVIKWDGKNWKDTLRNGDILIYSKGNGGHTYVFAQKDGEYYILEAGFERVYGHVEKVNKNKDTIKGSEYASHGLYILRAKNGISGTTNQFSGTISNTAQGNHDINATAISFAWPKGTDPKKWDLNESCNASGTEAFANYYNSVVPESTRNKANCKTHTDTYLLGASCSVFVGTVLKYSGLLPNTGSGGLSNFMVSELLTILTSDEGKKAGWEEVNDKNNLRPGDVIINPDQHTEIYVEIGGKGYIAVANHGGNSATAHHQFAHIKDFEKSAVSGSKRVFRNKNNTTANSACDMCAGNDNSMGLKKGGFTLEEAQSFMQPYIKEASKMKHGSGTYLGAYVNDAECAYGTLNNCVAFSQWFLNKYTALGGSNHKGAPTNNGKGMVGSLKERGLKTGTEPRPYAIFSEPGPSEYGHTGVVLGVADDYIIIGEAACSLGPSQGWPRVSKVSLSDTKSRGFTYAYTDDILIGI